MVHVSDVTPSTPQCQRPLLLLPMFIMQGMSMWCPDGVDGCAQKQPALSMQLHSTVLLGCAGKWAALLAAEQADGAQDTASAQGGSILPVQACRTELPHAAGSGVVVL